MSDRMSWLTALPLRYSAPGVLLLFTVIAGAGIYGANVRSVERQVERDIDRSLSLEAATLQHSLEYLYAHDAAAEVQQVLAEKLADTEIQTMVVADEQGLVIAAGRRANIGRNLHELVGTLQLRTPQLDAAVASGRAPGESLSFVTPDGELAVALYPVVLGVAPTEVRARRVGTILLVRELASRKARARHDVARDILGFAVPLTALALVLAVLMHFAVGRRAMSLGRAAQRFADGDLGARAALTGRDEIARLGRAFDDMAERVATSQRVLAESEQRFRAMAEAVPVMIWMADAEGRCTYLNQRGLDLTGNRRDEVYGHGWEKNLHPEDRAHVAQEFARSVALRAPCEVQERLLQSDGSYRWIDVYGVPRYDNGVFVGYIGVCTDITERKLADDALRSSEYRLRLFVEHAPVGAAMFDREMRFLVASERWLREYGLEGQNVAGMDFYAKFPQVAKIWKDVHQRAMAGEIVRNEKDKYVRADGKVDWVRWEIHPWRAGDGAIGGLVIFGEVITERILAEAERAQLEEQLRQAQKMEAIGTLAGGIAHDFNNILSTILGNAQLAQEDMAGTDPARRSIEEIHRAAQRGREVVQRLLAFSRPHAANRVPISLAPVADEVLQLLRSMLPAGVDLKLSLGEALPAVDADASQVHQVLLNLATNAWHAMEGHGGCIDVRIASCQVDRTLSSRHVELKPGAYVRLSVHDTGKGMDEATLARIFDPFFTTKPVGEGTGLGLAVVHGIMRSHGGAVRVESEPGRGSTFHLYFPVSTRAATVVETVVANPARVAPRGNAERILYVDDDESLVFLTERFLERLGYRVTGHTRAREAIAAFKADPEAFDLVITDFNMPGMSGFDVAQALWRIRPNVRIVLATGHVRQQDLDAAAKLGIFEVVLKPSAMDDLGPIVQRALAPEIGPVS